MSTAPTFTTSLPISSPKKPTSTHPLNSSASSSTTNMLHTNFYQQLHTTKNSSSTPFSSSAAFMSPQSSTLPSSSSVVSSSSFSHLLGTSPPLSSLAPFHNRGSLLQNMSSSNTTTTTNNNTNNSSNQGTLKQSSQQQSLQQQQFIRGSVNHSHETNRPLSNDSRGHTNNHIIDVVVDLRKSTDLLTRSVQQQPSQSSHTQPSIFKQSQPLSHQQQQTTPSTLLASGQHSSHQFAFKPQSSTSGSTQFLPKKATIPTTVIANQLNTDRDMRSGNTFASNDASPDSSTTPPHSVFSPRNFSQLVSEKLQRSKLPIEMPSSVRNEQFKQFQHPSKPHRDQEYPFSLRSSQEYPAAAAAATASTTSPSSVNLLSWSSSASKATSTTVPYQQHQHNAQNNNNQNSGSKILQGENDHPKQFSATLKHALEQSSRVAPTNAPKKNAKQGSSDGFIDSNLIIPLDLLNSQTRPVNSQLVSSTKQQSTAAAAVAPVIVAGSASKKHAGSSYENQRAITESGVQSTRMQNQQVPPSRLTQQQSQQQKSRNVGGYIVTNQANSSSNHSDSRQNTHNLQNNQLVQSQFDGSRDAAAAAINQNKTLPSTATSAGGGTASTANENKGRTRKQQQEPGLTIHTSSSLPRSKDYASSQTTSIGSLGSNLLRASLNEWRPSSSTTNHNNSEVLQHAATPSNHFLKVNQASAMLADFIQSTSGGGGGEGTSFSGQSAAFTQKQIHPLTSSNRNTQSAQSFNLTGIHSSSIIQTTKDVPEQQQQQQSQQLKHQIYFMQEKDRYTGKKSESQKQKSKKIRNSSDNSMAGHSLSNGNCAIGGAPAAAAGTTGASGIVFPTSPAIPQQLSQSCTQQSSSLLMNLHTSTNNNNNLNNIVNEQLLLRSSTQQSTSSANPNHSNSVARLISKHARSSNDETYKNHNISSSTAAAVAPSTSVVAAPTANKIVSRVQQQLSQPLECNSISSAVHSRQQSQEPQNNRGSFQAFPTSESIVFSDNNNMNITPSQLIALTTTAVSQPKKGKSRHASSSSQSKVVSQRSIGGEENSSSQLCELEDIEILLQQQQQSPIKYHTERSSHQPFEEQILMNNSTKKVDSKSRQLTTSIKSLNSQFESMKPNTSQNMPKKSSYQSILNQVYMLPDLKVLQSESVRIADSGRALSDRRVFNDIPDSKNSSGYSQIVRSSNAISMNRSNNSNSMNQPRRTTRPPSSENVSYFGSMQSLEEKQQHSHLSQQNHVRAPSLGQVISSFNNIQRNNTYQNTMNSDVEGQMQLFKSHYARVLSKYQQQRQQDLAKIAEQAMMIEELNKRVNQLECSENIWKLRVREKEIALLLVQDRLGVNTEFKSSEQLVDYKSSSEVNEKAEADTDQADQNSVADAGAGVVQLNISLETLKKNYQVVQEKKKRRTLGENKPTNIQANKKKKNSSSNKNKQRKLSPTDESAFTPKVIKDQSDQSQGEQTVNLNDSFKLLQRLSSKKSPAATQPFNSSQKTQLVANEDDSDLPCFANGFVFGVSAERTRDGDDPHFGPAKNIDVSFQSENQIGGQFAYSEFSVKQVQQNLKTSIQQQQQQQQQRPSPLVINLLDESFGRNTEAADEQQRQQNHENEKQQQRQMITAEISFEETQSVGATAEEAAMSFANQSFG